MATSRCNGKFAQRIQTPVTVACGTQSATNRHPCHIMHTEADCAGDCTYEGYTTSGGRKQNNKYWPSSKGVHSMCRSSSTERAHAALVQIVAGSKRHLRTVPPAVDARRDGPITSHVERVPLLPCRERRSGRSDVLAWVAGILSRGWGRQAEGKTSKSRFVVRFLLLILAVCFLCLQKTTDLV